MEIFPGIRVKGLSLIAKDVLIIADVHIGLEEALNKQGIFIPRFQFGEIIKKMEEILKGEKIKTVVIAGDLKHEFGEISNQEWRHTLQFLDFLMKHAKEIVLVRGNHDKILGPIASRRGIKVVESYSADDFIVLHGDKKPKSIKEKTIIIGHEHPAVTIGEGPRRELVKCFLVGKWKKKNLVVLPSFNLVHEGSDVLKEKLLSPFLRNDISDFEVYVVSDRIYSFGRLRNLR
ncbi:MAG TPA: metallophosphoesterase [Candidatus Nanoarchaeia archaeon]|nr:metallophosphoesterase [Candidatus Nanoarchaeia archaeon]